MSHDFTSTMPVLKAIVFLLVARDNVRLDKCDNYRAQVALEIHSSIELFYE